MRPPAGTRLRKSFWDRVEVYGECWVWMGATFSGGYGRVTWGGSKQRTHRLAYEDAKGPIPEGLFIDHLCHVRPCVNPDHMEPVTNRENILRGENQVAKQARQTHCKNGHPLSGMNLKIKHGCRVCRTCELANRRRRWAERKAERV